MSKAIAHRPRRPKPYEAEGHGVFRDALLNMIDIAPAELRVGMCLYLAVQTLETLAKSSILPTAGNMAAATADAVRDQIPCAVHDFVRSGGAPYDE